MPIQTLFSQHNTGQLYPKPDANGYLRGNLRDNLLGIRLFRYNYKQQPTMEMEIVHKNFLPATNFSYMITHIHTNIKYDVEPSEAIAKVINKITHNNKLVTQYNVRPGFNGSWRQYDGFYCNFITSSRGMPVTTFTQSTIDQLMQGFNNLTNQYPDYREQVYISDKTKAYQWYLDFLIKVQACISICSS